MNTTKRDLVGQLQILEAVFKYSNSNKRKKN